MQKNEKIKAVNTHIKNDSRSLKKKEQWEKQKISKPILKLLPGILGKTFQKVRDWPAKWKMRNKTKTRYIIRNIWGH